MRLHRFYIDKKIEGDTITIEESRLINQWKNVFRYKTGDGVILFDGSGKEFEAEISEIDNKQAVLNVKEEKEGIIPEKKIIFYQSLIKKDKMEWVVEKGTELGIAKIVPVLSERSEKKGFNIERARKIAIEASEQSGRADVPLISEIATLENALIVADKSKIVIFDPSGSEFSPIETEQEISIFIGPEGGWSQNELDKFKEKNAQIYSLGKLILRAETAAVAALSKFI